MHLTKKAKALSTLFTILLVLLAAVIGALVAYMWTMAPFYHEPEDLVDVIVTDVYFPVDRASQFDVTVMNPSHSISSTNVTDIYITVGGFNKTNIRSSEPELPAFLERGSTRIFNCSLDWGPFAGEIITVHVLTTNNTETARSVKTQTVKLEVDAIFDSTKSIEYFNATVTSVNSAITLNLTNVLFDYDPVENMSITLPRAIEPNETLTFTCYVNWQGHVQPIVKVETLQGYTGEIRKEASATVSLQVADVDFDLINTSRVNITLSNSADSLTAVTISNITIRHGNITDTITGDLASPVLPANLNKNQTEVFACHWNWTDAEYRDINVVATAYTEQGFVSQPMTARTPAVVAGEISNLTFDLDDTAAFSLDIGNMPYSLHSVNVTRIVINEQNVTMSPAIIVPGENSTFICEFNWSSYVGGDVTLRAHLEYDSQVKLVDLTMRLPYFKVADASFGNGTSGTPEVKIRLNNSEFSSINATIAQLHIRNATVTLLDVSSVNLEVAIGSEIEVTYSFDWPKYVNQDLTVVATAADGFQASSTFRAE